MKKKKRKINKNKEYIIECNKIKTIINNVGKQNSIIIKEKKNVMLIKDKDFVFKTKNINKDKIRGKKTIVEKTRKKATTKKTIIKTENKKLLKCLIVNMITTTTKTIKNKSKGINIIIKKKNIHIYSTDNFRITHMKIKNKEESNIKNKISINISKNTAKTIISTLKNNIKNKEVKITIIETKKVETITLKINKFTIIIKEISKINSNYKIIKEKKGYKKNIIDDTSNIRKTIERIYSISNERNNYLEAIFKKNKIKIVFKNDINELMKEEITAKNNITKKIKIKVNIKFMLDFLKNIKKNSKIDIYVKKHNKKIILKNKEKITYLIMPIVF